MANKRKLKILFLQKTPCIRNYKMAQALRKIGHHITLAYTEKKLSEAYSGLSDSTYNDLVKINDYRELWDISKKYDLVHSHNEPDTLSVAALACSIPLIHDTHDLISLRRPDNMDYRYFEGIANRGAAGRIYTTIYQQREAATLYAPEGPSLVFNNYASEDDLPTNFLPKVSKKDGEVHFVYEGGIGYRHRDFRPIFVEMAMKGLHVHIYPAKFDPEIAAFFSKFDKIHYNKPVSPKVLMEEMTQFDYGIIPWNLENANKRFLDSTIANKLFEYIAAGLPVATTSIQSYEDWFEKNPLGVTFKTIDELISKIDTLSKMRSLPFSEHIYTFEREIHKVESFYYLVLKKQGLDTSFTGQFVDADWKKEVLKGEELVANGRIDSAIKVFENVPEDSGFYHIALNNLGVIYSSQGENKQALIMLKQALSLKPDYEEAQKNIQILSRKHE